MPEEDLGTRQLQEAEEVADVIFPAGDEPARVVEPGEEAFDLPAAPVTPQRTAILRRAAARAIRGNHLDAVLVAQLGIQQVTIVAAVAD